MSNLSIYTDGACSGNPGPGGWAFFIRELDIEGQGYEVYTTNNRMELSGVTNALLEVLLKKIDNSVITIYSDSKYVTDAFNKSWLKNWAKNNWRTASGSPVANQDLWNQLTNAVLAHELTNNNTLIFQWVKGHGSDPMNILVDSLACEMRDVAKEEMKNGQSSC